MVTMVTKLVVESSATEHIKESMPSQTTGLSDVAASSFTDESSFCDLQRKHELYSLCAKSDFLGNVVFMLQ